jgi:hypothetical protein
MGHKEIKTTMIYTHVLNRSPLGVHSPADLLQRAEPLQAGPPIKPRMAPTYAKPLTAQQVSRAALTPPALRRRGRRT